MSYIFEYIWQTIGKKNILQGDFYDLGSVSNYSM